jgi:hypothetical protein
MDNMNNLYLCIKNSKNEFIPFFTVNGSFFSKIQGNSSNNKLTGGSSSISIDEFLQHVNYTEILENDKNKDVQIPSLDTNDSTSKGGNNQHYEIEISKNNVEGSALPEDFKNYLRHKLNNIKTK